VSVTGGYYFNTGGYFRNTAALSKNRVTDNLLVTSADYDPYCVIAPKDPRLPNGGGYEVCGFADVKGDKFGQNQSVVAPSSRFGKPIYRNHFVNFSTDMRFRGGGRLGGGVDTGWSLRDNCFIVDTPQDLLNCHVVTPVKGQTQVKINGSLPLPMRFVIAGTLQNLPGPQYQASYTMPTADVRSNASSHPLGRDLAGGTRTVSVQLIPPNVYFEDRVSRLDLRLSKVFQLAPRRRLQINLDAYNALNSSGILAVQTTFDARWRQPTSILDPRLFQISGNYSF